MKTALCTISANNFLPYGLDCLYSNKKFNDYDFFYLIADEFNKSLYKAYNDAIHFLNLSDIGIEQDELIQLEFKYTIVEFNTCVKPSLYKYLFSLGYDNVIYLDPDIESYSKFSYLDDLLTKNSIVLTPHKCTDQPSSFFMDNDFLNNGIYNLGFIAMHKSETTFAFLNWWDKALRDSCYLDYAKGMATDQIWANLVPIYYDRVYITKHPGMNLAFWNIDERNISIENNSIKINGEDLLFIHYSSLSIGCKSTLLEQIYSIRPEFKIIYEKHIENIKSYNFDEFNKIQYKYNYYNNNKPITKEEKRFFGYANLRKQYDNPFSTSVNTYFYALKKNKIKFSSKSLNKYEKKLVRIINIFGIKTILKISKYLSAFNIHHISGLYAN